MGSKMLWNLLSNKYAILGFTLGAIVFAEFQDGDDEISCTLDGKVGCPADMCCVRNESNFNHMICQTLGQQESLCANYSSEFICPCKAGFFCEPNTDDLFGTCKEKECNINVKPDPCPPTHCCVRDDYLFTYTYCKPFGAENSTCVIHHTQFSFECPCQDGFHCQSNLHGGLETSLFGTCKTNTVSVG